MLKVSLVSQVLVFPRSRKLSLDSPLVLTSLPSLLLQPLFISDFSVLTKTRNELKQPETSQNEPKPVKTSRNHPKRSKTSRNDPRKIAKQPETTQNFEIGEIWNFLLVFVFRISCPNAQIQAFWAKKYQLSNLLTKFSVYPISKVLISNLAFVSQNVELKCPILGILGQKVLPFKSFEKISLVHYFEGADFKSNICFSKF